MAEQDEPTALQRRALSYVFGVDREHYEAERSVWGLPVVFRVLTPADTQAADYAADALGDSPGAATMERAIQCLARSIVTINGDPYVGEYAPGDDRPEAKSVLAARTAHLRALPALLVVELANQYETVNQEFDRLLHPESVKN